VQCAVGTRSEAKKVTAAADGAWSACGRVERAAVRQRCPPAERDCPLAKGIRDCL